MTHEPFYQRWLPNLDSRLLVVETDGFVTRALVVRREGKSAAIEALAESRQTSADAALDEALAALGVAKLPRRAILLTHEVITSIVPLPVNPAKPRAADEMHELVRLELEPQVAIQSGARPIGEILVGLGALSYEQVAEVLAEQEQLREPRGAGTARRGVARFGEIARSLGLVTNDQLDRALGLQQQFRLSSDDLVCGWVGQSGELPQQPGMYRWLVSGMDRGTRDAWHQRFAAHRIELRSIYPQLASSTAAVEVGEACFAAVIDMQPGMICATRLSLGAIDSQTMQLSTGRLPTVELCADLIGRAPLDAFWVSGRSVPSGSFVSELSALLRAPHQPWTFVVAEGLVAPPLEALAGPLGAALCEWRRGTRGALVGVGAQDPGPPLWQRLEVVQAAAALIVALFILYSEITLRGTLSRSTAQLAAAQQELAVVQGESNVEKARAESVKQLRAELVVINDQKNEYEHLLQVIEGDLADRNAFVRQLLDVLAASINEDVAVDQIREENQQKQQFVISGWALSTQSAEQFIDRVGRRLPSWELSVGKRKLSEKTGRFKLDGYAWEVELHPNAHISKVKSLKGDDAPVPQQRVAQHGGQP